MKTDHSQWLVCNSLLQWRKQDRVFGIPTLSPNQKSCHSTALLSSGENLSQGHWRDGELTVQKGWNIFSTDENYPHSDFFLPQLNKERWFFFNVYKLYHFVNWKTEHDFVQIHMKRFLINQRSKFVQNISILFTEAIKIFTSEFDFCDF